MVSTQCLMFAEVILIGVFVCDSVYDCILCVCVRARAHTCVGLFKNDYACSETYICVYLS